MPSRQRLFLSLRIASWLAVGACVVVFARSLDWDQVFRSFEGADLRLALIATLVGLPCTALQGLRWSSLVCPAREQAAADPHTLRQLKLLNDVG